MRGQYIHEVEKLLEKYEDIEKNMIVMDDYDGGQAAQLRQVIDDLRELDRNTISYPLKENEKTS